MKTKVLARIKVNPSAAGRTPGGDHSLSPTFISTPHPGRLTARFYRTSQGREPVREWLQKFSPEDRKILAENVTELEFSWPVGMPLVRNLGDGLSEMRSRLTKGRIARITFAVENDCILLLQGFV